MQTTTTLTAPFQKHRAILGAGIIAAILVVLICSVLALRYMREQAEARVVVTTQNMAKSMSLTFEGILDAIDIALLTCADDIGQQMSNGHPDRLQINRYLDKQQRRLPVVPYLRASDAAGDILYGAGIEAPVVSMLGRDYFSLLRSQRQAALTISVPLFGRISKQWIWLFARRIDKADGAFGGVVYAVLDTAQIEAILAQIKLERGASIVLRGAGFEAIAGRIGASPTFPVPIGDRQLSPQFRQALQRDAQSGSYVSAESQLDRARHIFSYQHSQKYGFNIVVGENDANAMAEWRRQAWTVAVLVAAFALLSLMFFKLMSRSWQRQVQDIAALHESQLSLREAQEIAAIGSLSYNLRSGSWTSSDLLDQIMGIDQHYPRDTGHLLQFIELSARADIRAYLNSAHQHHMPFDREHAIIRQADGEKRWVHAKGKVRLTSDQRELMLICTIQDITERKLAEHKIRSLAYYDMLTGLPNRRLLLDRLQHALTANLHSAREGALLLIDLDNFKTLNDTHGHGVGDQLLCAVSARIVACVREVDTVARLGGDEFIVMLVDLADNEAEAALQAEMVGEKIRVALCEGFTLDHQQYHGTPSIGITLFAGQRHPIDELMKRADTAMYQAKGAGRNIVRFFDPAMQASVAARVALESDLRSAIDERQFLLHYQAQIGADGRVTGVEALVRWRHPVRGLVSPAEFIPLAEGSGLILPLGHWVLQTACAQLATWARRPDTAALSMAVNVSARQFGQPDFVEQVLAVLAHSGARPERLKLELTEGLLLENAEAVIATMSALKARGVGFSLDDFGTGYSSLSYLKRLPLDQLKIDQSFVRDVLVNPNDAAIARTIVTLGKSLGMAVIAEGVETAAQRDFLADAGCYAYQGYFFSRPLAPDQFEAYLESTLAEAQTA